MRCVYYVVVAGAIFARSTVSAAFTNADESTLLSKTAPAFAIDTTIGSESRKRFLRAHDLENGELTPADEERTKYGSLAAIIKKLEEKDMLDVAKILENMDEIHGQNMLKAAKSKMSSEQYQAAKNALNDS
ncbi:RxLR effector protein [Phytophthora megakarya]|uniref:RxLR effector protein n=1 Tax=Phytophthora megakarya TaxID=4795 RepID=A0A225W5I3_9STRA|nr:RxLR effector protein [Phytophthora megakarya]